ncbi:MAG TPA: FGGY-family carbohydrate kinase [Candidatus Baltobacteraceae bacterium]|nr:FGGY-family carbohydrate kinase [Candidatus Baltobacteraceae bacterium]
MNRDLLLAIDNGTQSVRALVFDANGTLAAKYRVLLDDYQSPQPGWHEHDAVGFWEALCDACRGVWREHPELRERIAAVAVTAQRGTVVNVDETGAPLRPAITWLDQRKCDDFPSVSPLWRAAFAAAGVTGTIRYFQREAEATWIRSQQPGIWKRTHKYLLLSGYLLYRLTGRFVDSVGSQVGYIPFDYKALSWAKPSDWKWQAVPIDPERLPELIPPATIAGEITAAAANATGIPAGTRLVTAASDKACEVLGAGVTSNDIGVLSYGTTATINVCSARYVEASPFIPPYPAAIPGAYNVEVQIFRGYWMATWFAREFGIDLGDLDELLARAPAGSNGLLLQPYWSPGIKNPGPEAKGAIVGFGDVHTRAHIYRAALEGLAYALREGKERIERRGGLRVTSLRACGGGSQSERALQLTADVFDLPVARPHVYEASGLGAAIDAAVGIGLHRDFESATRSMTRIAETFEPDPKNRRLYDDLYAQVYRRLYSRLRPLYEAIARITGYPR